MNKKEIKDYIENINNCPECDCLLPSIYHKKRCVVEDLLVHINIYGVDYPVGELIIARNIYIENDMKYYLDLTSDLTFSIRVPRTNKYDIELPFNYNLLEKILHSKSKDIIPILEKIILLK